MEKEEMMWGMGCHLATFASFAGVPLGNIIGPLVVWLIKKDESEFVNHHGKEAMNFQISMTLYALLCIPLCFVLIGFVLLPIVIIMDLVLTIIALTKAKNGEWYEYPFTMRFI